MNSFGNINILQCMCSVSVVRTLFPCFTLYNVQGTRYIIVHTRMALEIFQCLGSVCGFLRSYNREHLYQGS